MYAISFCRLGKYRVANKKGCFIKHFKTIDEIVKFYVSVYGKLYTPKVRTELTKKEFVIFIRKLGSQLTKRNLA